MLQDATPEQQTAGFMEELIRLTFDLGKLRIRIREFERELRRAADVHVRRHLRFKHVVTQNPSFV